jgi:hypothetical protein
LESVFVAAAWAAGMRAAARAIMVVVLNIMLMR